MDVSLNEVIDEAEKGQDELVEETTTNLNETEEEQVNMPESVNTTQSGSTGNFHYQIRNPDNGQVTYRVVQVGGDENNQQATLSIVTTNGILNQLSQEEGGGGGSPQEQVAIVSNPFNTDSGGDATTNAASGNTASGTQRFAYFASGANASTDLPSPTSSGTANTAQTEQQLLSSGQFYVMMSPQEMIQSSGTGATPRAILGRASFQSRSDDTRTPRDDTRRVQHNEVERRRRDKINTWILKLATVIPDCANDHSKQGQSKGGILAKAYDYINDLQHANTQLSESLKDCEQLQLNYEMCRQKLEDCKQKIQMLTQTLQAHQIEFPTSQSQ